MNSIFLTDSNIDSHTGGGIVSYNLLEVLKQYSNVVSIMANFPKEMPNIIDKKPNIINLNPAHYSYPADPPFFKDYLAYNNLPQDLIHLVLTYACPFGLTVDALKKRGFCRIIADIAPHSIELSRQEHETFILDKPLEERYPYPHLKDEWLWKLYSKHLRLADAVVVHSKKGAEYIHKKAELDKKPYVIPHGCEIPKVEPELPMDKIRVGYFGALGLDKGFHYLLSLMMKLKMPFYVGGKDSVALQQVPGINVVGSVDDLADFYKNINVYVQPCYSKDTQIMTDKGLKTIDEINEKDFVWTLNSDNILELNKIKKIHHHKYKGMMVEIKNKQINQLITPNHRVYHYSQKDSRTQKVREARELLDKNIKIHIPTTGIWCEKEAMFIIFPKQKGNNGKAKNMKKFVDYKIFMELLGWYIAEGCISKYDKHVCISAHKESAKERIKYLVNEIGLHPIEDKGDIMIYSLQLCKIFEECGKGAKNKKIPDEYLDSSKKDLIHLYNGMMAGDGSRRGHHVLYYTSSNQLKDDFIELCLKLGYSTKTWWRKSKEHIIIKTGQKIKEGWGWMISIHEKYNRGTIKTRDHIKLIPYNDRVWCIETENKNLLIERDGLLSFSGNSVTEGFGITALEAMAYGRPVIVTEWVGMADYIKNGEEGFVVPIRNPQAIYDKILYFNDNPLEVKRMGRNARMLAERLSWDFVRELYLDCFDEVMA